VGADGISEGGGVNERIAQHALARHFNYFSQNVVPNVYIGGGEMDVAVVTRAGYLVEVEIKLTLADWNADQAKDKWLPERAKYRAAVSRFYYAVPTALLQKVPSWVPASCGLIELQWAETRKTCYAVERKPAGRIANVKLTDADMLILLRSTYHRFWQRELRAA
jgi:hypothetical protein